MARTRELKAQFFTDGKVRKLPMPARYLFQALWCLADREGRLADDPDDIEVYVGDIGMTIDEALDALHPHFITRYEIDGARYIQVNNFSKHQHIHPREVASQIPPIPVPVREKANLGEPFHGEATPRREIPPMPSKPSMPSGSSLGYGGGSLYNSVSPYHSQATDSDKATVEDATAHEEWNPFGDAPPLRPTVESYIANHLPPMTPGNIDELRGFQDAGMQDDAIQFAVDQAAAQGKRTWAYVKGILKRWEAANIFTGGAARAAEDKHQTQTATRASPATSASDRTRRFMELAKECADEEERDNRAAGGHFGGVSFKQG